MKSILQVSLRAMTQSGPCWIMEGVTQLNPAAQHPPWHQDFAPHTITYSSHPIRSQAGTSQERGRLRRW